MTGKVAVIHEASSRKDLNDWGQQPDIIKGSSHSSGLLLDKRYDGAQETGLWQVTEGTWPLAIPSDEFCYFTEGRATYKSDAGEIVEVEPQTAVMFPKGWKGVCTVHETLRNTYILAKTDPRFKEKDGMMRVSYKKKPLEEKDVKDWGVIPTMIEGESHISGILIHKGPEGQSECGVWNCTPGKWDCHVTRDEFCHFLEGSCTYTGEDGQVIEVEPDTIAFFPEDWKGVCEVHETIRKVYMIR